MTHGTCKLVEHLIIIQKKNRTFLKRFAKMRRFQLFFSKSEYGSRFPSTGPGYRVRVQVYDKSRLEFEGFLSTHFPLHFLVHLELTPLLPVKLRKDVRSKKQEARKTQKRNHTILHCSRSIRRNRCLFFCMMH